MFFIRKKMPLLLLFLICFIALPLSARASLKCTQCHKTIHGKYLKSTDGKIFCSKRCFKAYSAKKMPKCAVCHKPCFKGYKKDGKYYCSKKCLYTTFPTCHRCHRHAKHGVVIGDKKIFFCKRCAAKPRCFACGLPMPGNYLEDHRFICKKCAKTAIMDNKTAQLIFDNVRAHLDKNLGFSTKHTIRFTLVSQDKLNNSTPGHAAGRELGLFIYEKNIVRTTRTFNGKSSTKETIKSQKYTIYALYGLPKKKFIEVIAHELGHDWMQEYFPKITDLKIKEGWAEFLASQANIMYKQGYMNRRMQHNPNPIYGDGYRLINTLAKHKGIKGVINYFKQLSN